MADIDTKEMTFEVVIGGVAKGIEAATSSAQKGIVEAFKTAASQDALSAISGRLGMALPYATVTFAKVATKHGYDAIKITLAIRSGEAEKVAREIFTTAVSGVTGGGTGSLAVWLASGIGPFAIPVGVGVGLIFGNIASNFAGELWDNALRHTAAGQWSSHQVGNLFNMSIKRTIGPAPTTPAQINDVPAANKPLDSMLVLDPTDRKAKIIFNTSKVIDPDVAPSAHSYTVQKGDTLWSIAKRNGWDERALKAANPQISDKNFIREGQIINKPANAPTSIDNSRSPIINIIADPQVKKQIKGEDQAAQDVQQGYAHKTPTSSIQFQHGELNSSLFKNSQRASFVTNGVRPGAFQIDPNPQPAQWLAEHAHLDPVINAVVYSGLAAGATQQTYVDPIVLDINGDGIHLTDYKNNGVLFDIDHSGQQTRTGWVSSEDGLLVHDANGDGIINNVSETFSEYTSGSAGANGQPGTRPYANGWEALDKHDSNHDNVIDNEDEIWNNLRVWIDSNHDGKSWNDNNRNGHLDPGEQTELKTLDELGISQIDLNTTAIVPGEMRDGNRVLQKGRFTLRGQIRDAWGVDFIADPIHHTLTQHGTGQLLTSQANQPGQDTVSIIKTYVSQSRQGETLDANILDVRNIYAGHGSDTLIAHTQGSWLVGNGGSNTYIGKEGDDVFVISASDQQANINGGGGTNTIIFAGNGAITLNMAEANIHLAQAGKGDATIISGGRTGVYIKGGDGNNILMGGAGDDVIVGGRGKNLIIGGTGKAVIYAGLNDDVIYGASQASIISLGGGHDQVFAGDDNDVIKLGTGNATIDGGAGTNIVELQGSYTEYTIDKLNDPSLGEYRIIDKVANRNGIAILKKIQKLTFNDISAVALNGVNAMPVTDNIRVNQHGQALSRYSPQLISANQLLANDHRFNSQGGLRISAVSDAVGGSASLTSSGDILFTPDSRYSGIMRFKYTVVDSVGNPAASAQDLNTGETAPMRAQVTLLTPDIPHEPLIGQQHYLSDARVFRVWEDGYSGQGIRIGQFEPGGEFSVGPEIFDYTHTDLAPNIDNAWLVAQRQANTLPTTFSDHATRVAGVMVAAKNNQGIVGIAYNAKIAGHYLANNGSDVSALSYLNNYDIANHSWGFKQDFAISNRFNGRINTQSALLANIRYATEHGRAGLGTINVTVGGNARAQGGSAQGSYTNNNRFSIQVGAVNIPGDLSTLTTPTTPFSNPGASLLISASGNQIISTSQQVQNGQGTLHGNHNDITQGTSFAAPIASSVIALMLEANPHLGYRDIQTILAVSAYKIHDPNTQWQYNFAKNWNGGGMHASHDYGFGHIDARAAVHLAETWMGQKTGKNIYFYEAQSSTLAQTAHTPITHILRLDHGVHIEHIEIDLDLNFERLGDAVVKLISPNGTQSILLNRPGKIPVGITGAHAHDLGDSRSGNLRYTFTTTHHWGESSAGDWKLEVTDATTGTPLTLNQWGIRAYGNKHHADDTYIYTDEYKTALAQDSRRGVLDDAVNGTAGGRNTLNAAAVTGDVIIYLTSGQATLDGAALTIKNPSHIHHLISGDGNDTLVAATEKSILDGGRGTNHLRGGSSQDIFVVRERGRHSDTVHEFKADQGDTIYLIGLKGKKYHDLIRRQIGADTEITWGTMQSILLKNTPVHTINEQRIILQDTLQIPEAYFNSASAVTQLLAGQGEIKLIGGKAYVSLTQQNGQMQFTLAGTIYQRNAQFAVNRFTIHAQAQGTDNYGNAIQGFRPGIDKIDVSALGIKTLNDIDIEINNRGVINGVASIRGSTIKAKLPGEPGKKIELAYLDTIDPAQLSAQDFIFSPPGPIKVDIQMAKPKVASSLVSASRLPHTTHTLNGDEKDNVLRAEGALANANTRLNGMGGRDHLHGGLGNDVLDGGAGNDWMCGYAGSDTYLFYRNAGQDWIYESAHPLAETDVVMLGDDIQAEDLLFKQEGNHLAVYLLGTTDKLTIENWYLSEWAWIEEFKLANGKTLLSSQVASLVSAMSGFTAPVAGQTTPPADYYKTVAPVIAASWK